MKNSGKMKERDEMNGRWMMNNKGLYKFNKITNEKLNGKDRWIEFWMNQLKEKEIIEFRDSVNNQKNWDKICMIIKRNKKEVWISGKIIEMN